MLWPYRPVAGSLSSSSPAAPSCFLALDQPVFWSRPDHASSPGRCPAQSLRRLQGQTHAAGSAPRSRRVDVARHDLDAPFGLLSPQTRNRRGFIPESGTTAAGLVTTPADGPFPFVNEIDSTGAIPSSTSGRCRARSRRIRWGVRRKLRQSERILWEHLGLSDDRSAGHGQTIRDFLLGPARWIAGLGGREHEAEGANQRDRRQCLRLKGEAGHPRPPPRDAIDVQSAADPGPATRLRGGRSGRSQCGV